MFKYFNLLEKNIYVFDILLGTKLQQGQWVTTRIETTAEVMKWLLNNKLQCGMF